MAKAEWGWSKQDPEWVRSSDYLSAGNRESREPLSVEQKKALLTTEYLSQLSLGEYLALWRRLNPHMLTKVSRQGFIDHTIDKLQYWDLFHFSSDFERELASGKLLRGRIHENDVMDGSPERVQAWLGAVLEEPTKELALERLQEKLGTTSEVLYRSGLFTYARETKVSLQSLDVLPSAYGSERKNAIFTVFPTDVVLSQYRFQIHRENALWIPTMNRIVDVWPKEVGYGGLSQDAGIVFLPKFTQVDPETGSRYASAPNDSPKFSGDVWQMKERPELPSLFMEQMSSIPEVRRIVEMVEQEWQTERNGEIKKRVEDFRMHFPSLLHNLGYDDVAIEVIVRRSCDRLMNGKNPFDPDFSLLTLAYSGALFERPRETISSQEFWERRFAKTPEQKPARVVFYEGEPLEAVQRFLKVFGIEAPRSKPKAGHLLGFDDHLITDLTKDPQMIQGWQEFWDLCIRTIDARYI